MTQAEFNIYAYLAVIVFVIILLFGALIYSVFLAHQENKIMKENNIIQNNIKEPKIPKKVIIATPKEEQMHAYSLSPIVKQDKVILLENKTVKKLKKKPKAVKTVRN